MPGRPASSRALNVSSSATPLPKVCEQPNTATRVNPGVFSRLASRTPRRPCASIVFTTSYEPGWTLRACTPARGRAPAGRTGRADLPGPAVVRVASLPPAEPVLQLAARADVRERGAFVRRKAPAHHAFEGSQRGRQRQHGQDRGREPHPFTTRSGTKRATGRASPARATTSTTSAASL